MSYDPDQIIPEPKYAPHTFKAFQTKPRSVEAWQFEEHYVRRYFFGDGKLPYNVVCLRSEYNKATATIHRADFGFENDMGHVRLNVGDWIVSNEDGEFRIVADDEFHRKYEPTTPRESSP